MYDFIREFDAFLKHCSNVLISKNEKVLTKTEGQKDVILRYLENYRKVFDDTNPTSLYPTLLKLWGDIKANVLKGYKVDGVRNDKWLLDGSFTLKISDDPKTKV